MADDKIDTGPILGCLLVLVLGLVTGAVFAAPFWYFGGAVNNVLGCLVWFGMKWWR
tara:strand:- start:791 stop:958 length:168 start_codon:yes stop_codon:yes gene_type:complete